MIFSIINFVVMLFSFLMLAYFYTLSIEPMKRSQKHGEKAWNECKRFRLIGGFFETVSVINMVLWIWFPLPLVDTWIISPNIWVGILIGMIFLIPCLILMSLGVKDAGSETLTPSKDTEMYGGIYNYIRHPQTVGEFPIFVAIAFLLNSWFLVIISTLFVVIYVPIMIHYEEKDLVRRFGDKYVQYKKRTGAIFPKIRKSDTQKGEE